ncbi:MAG: PEP-CTERM sorting domain-containing protein [Pirellulales bacterium]|nr:PEP-CTERM sorting domain-containing protein [Pirellulales bacterium]
MAAHWNYGTPPSEASAVPEPTALVLLLGLSAMLLSRRRP